MMTFISNRLSRRAVLLTGAAAFGVAVASPLAAFTTGEAEALVDRLVGDINAVIASGKSESAMIQDFEGIFARYGDVPAIARSALGPTARSLSSSQLSAYTDAFSGYISRKYGKRFREFIGGRIEVNGAKPAGNLFEVSTTAFLRGSSPFEVTFVVIERSGRQRFVNMLIEGVNMLASERVEVSAILDRNQGNVSGLINDLNRAG